MQNFSTSEIVGLVKPCFIIEVEDEVETEDEGVGFTLTSVVEFWLSKLGLPPSFPQDLRTSLIFSSLTMRRDIKAPVDSQREATPYSKSVVNVVVRIWLSKPSSFDNAISDIGLLFRINFPRCSDSCMKQRISNQTPRSWKFKDWTPASFRQSPG